MKWKIAKKQRLEEEGRLVGEEIARLKVQIVCLKTEVMVVIRRSASESNNRIATGHDGHVFNLRSLKFPVQL